MRFATIDTPSGEQAAVLVDGDRWVPVGVVDADLSGDLLVLIRKGWSREQLHSLSIDASQVAERFTVPVDQARYRPPYRLPHKIVGVGLNYQRHAADLGETAPDEPASFLKGTHTIVGATDLVTLPDGETVTAEAELGVVMAQEARDVEEARALDNVFGFCAILDQTAVDILGRNPRFLTRAKNFPTFFSFGPEVVTVDEFLEAKPLGQIRVTTNVDGTEVTNFVASMTHSPVDLICFFSRTMPWFPGDILSTGTPGALTIQDGSTATASIEGLMSLVNPIGSSAPRRGQE